MAMNPIFSGIPAYLDETKEELKVKSALGSKTAGLMTVEAGVKGATAIHTLLTEVELQNANACGFNAQGDQTISQRVLTPAYVKVNMTWCDKNFLNTYKSYQVQLAAKTKTLPYEQDFFNGIADQINEANEKMLWQGDSSDGVSCDGLLKIIGAESSVVKVARQTSVYETVKALYLATPEAVLEKDDFTIFMGMGDFRNLVQELVAANLYHVFESDADGSIKLPGTNATIVGVNGLNGTNKIVAARKSNLILGTDMLSNSEVYDFWFSEDDRVFKLAVEYNLGTQIVFPDEVAIAE